METPHHAFLDKEPVAPAIHGGRTGRPRRGPSAFFDPRSTGTAFLVPASSRSRVSLPTLLEPPAKGDRDEPQEKPGVGLPALRRALDGGRGVADVGRSRGLATADPLPHLCDRPPGLVLPVDAMPVQPVHAGLARLV